MGTQHQQQQQQQQQQPVIVQTAPPPVAPQPAVVHRCACCRSAFISHAYLTSHYQRRHPNQPIPTEHPTVIVPPGDGVSPGTLTRWKQEMTEMLEAKITRAFDAQQRTERGKMNDRLSRLEENVKAYFISESTTIQNAIAKYDSPSKLEVMHQQLSHESQNILKEIRAIKSGASRSLFAEDESLSRDDFLFHVDEQKQKQAADTHPQSHPSQQTQQPDLSAQDQEKQEWARLKQEQQEAKQRQIQAAELSRVAAIEHERALERAEQDAKDAKIAEGLAQAKLRKQAIIERQQHEAEQALRQQQQEAERERRRREKQHLPPFTPGPGANPVPSCGVSNVDLSSSPSRSSPTSPSRSPTPSRSRPSRQLDMMEGLGETERLNYFLTKRELKKYAVVPNLPFLMARYDHTSEEYDAVAQRVAGDLQLLATHDHYQLLKATLADRHLSSTHEHVRQQVHHLIRQHYRPDARTAARIEQLKQQEQTMEHQQQHPRDNTKTNTKTNTNNNSTRPKSSSQAAFRGSTQFDALSLHGHDSQYFPHSPSPSQQHEGSARSSRTMTSTPEPEPEREPVDENDTVIYGDGDGDGDGDGHGDTQFDETGDGSILLGNSQDFAVQDRDRLRDARRRAMEILHQRSKQTSHHNNTTQQQHQHSQSQHQPRDSKTTRDARGRRDNDSPAASHHSRASGPTRTPGSSLLHPTSTFTTTSHGKPSDRDRSDRSDRSDLFDAGYNQTPSRGSVSMIAQRIKPNLSVNIEDDDIDAASTPITTITSNQTAAQSDHTTAQSRHSIPMFTPTDKRIKSATHLLRNAEAEDFGMDEGERTLVRSNEGMSTDELLIPDIPIRDEPFKRPAEGKYQPTSSSTTNPSIGTSPTSASPSFAGQSPSPRKGMSAFLANKIRTMEELLTSKEQESVQLAEMGRERAKRERDEALRAKAEAEDKQRRDQAEKDKQLLYKMELEKKKMEEELAAQMARSPAAGAGGAATAGRVGERTPHPSERKHASFLPQDDLPTDDFSMDDMTDQRQSFAIDNAGETDRDRPSSRAAAAAQASQTGHTTTTTASQHAAMKKQQQDELLRKHHEKDRQEAERKRRDAEEQERIQIQQAQREQERQQQQQQQQQPQEQQQQPQLARASLPRDSIAHNPLDDVQDEEDDGADTFEALRPAKKDVDLKPTITRNISISLAPGARRDSAGSESASVASDDGPVVGLRDSTIQPGIVSRSRDQLLRSGFGAMGLKSPEQKSKEDEERRRVLAENRKREQEQQEEERLREAALFGSDPQGVIGGFSYGGASVSGRAPLPSESPRPQFAKAKKASGSGAAATKRSLPTFNGFKSP